MCSLYPTHMVQYCKQYMYGMQCMHIMLIALRSLLPLQIARSIDHACLNVQLPIAIQVTCYIRTKPTSDLTGLACSLAVTGLVSNASAAEVFGFLYDIMVAVLLPAV